MKLVLRAALFAVLALGYSVPARPQALPSEPVTFADGRVTVGGDVAASIGAADPGFFNWDGRPFFGAGRAQHRHFHAA